MSDPVTVEDVFTDPVNEGAWTEDTFTESKPVEDTDKGTPGEAAPKKRKEPRASLESIGSLAWAGTGMWLEKSGADIPVGRVMQFQAPLAGSKLDKILADTVIDTILQPFVRQTDKLEDLGVLIGLPLAIGLYERNPSLEPLVAGLLRQLLDATILDMAPLLQAKQRKRKTAAKNIGELNDLLGIDKDTDPVEALLYHFFRPVEQESDSDTET